jgi:protein-L-isoaspartate(D-aspartate) O-methyltransferase
MTTEDDPGSERRARMVERDLRRRGVGDRRVLDAMATVPRERFVAEELAEFAYEDSPLPIGAGQTISQPLIVATMAEAAEIGPGDRVLEVGAGSGYGAAVLGHVAHEVWSVERHEVLVAEARRRIRELGYDNVHIVEGDGTLGWPEAAPFDAIVVTAGAPSVPASLFEQLVEGGRLVIPIGAETRGQELARIRRVRGEAVVEDLGPVRFVPLVGRQGWDDPLDDGDRPASAPPRPGVVVNPPGRGRIHGLPELVAESAEPISSIEGADLGPLLERIGDATVVLLGEATHGTSEFYRMRERVTRALVERKGFSAIAVEADWPDAARIDRFVRSRPELGTAFEPFERFPTWMWRNAEVAGMVRWLRDHNAGVEDPSRQVSFHGLDLYSLFTSRDEVLAYLERVDPDAARIARHRYSCLSPWQQDPAAYGRAVVTGRFEGCADAVVANLAELLRRRVADAARHGDDYLDAAQNAVVVTNAERYYRVMYSGSRESWNLRDQHMFETLQVVRAARGPGAKVVVWEHNSHVGDAAATEMGARGELNVGMLCRREFADDAFLVGFGTHEGSVAAATEWGGPMERKAVRPSHRDSYERVCHDAAVPAFLLHLREPRRAALRDELAEPRLERAIGVIYRPETEMQSHYFQASLPVQFDEYVWFDRSEAVHPLVPHETEPGLELFPSGL